MNALRFIAWGTGFGFILSRARATDYDSIAGMFAFEDLHLLLVIGGAVAVGALTLRLATAWRHRRGLGTVLGKTSITAGGLFGAGIFGLGWGLSGACPGTAIAQVGEGKVLALLTIAGMIAGTWLQAWFAAARERRQLTLVLREAELQMTAHIANSGG